MITFLLTGTGLEYVLKPLADFLRQANQEVIEVDNFVGTDQIHRVKSLAGKKIIFVTSDHLFWNSTSFNRRWGTDIEFLGPMEIIAELNPILSICFQHDLMTPFLEEDLRWLSLFDYTFVAFPGLEHLNTFTRIVENGWIKKKAVQSRSSDSIKLAQVLCGVKVYCEQGQDHFLNMFKSIPYLVDRIQLPRWSGTSELHQSLESKGLTLYPLGQSVGDIISECEVIVTNNVSSVNIEAALSGRHVINILDNPFTVQEQKLALSSFSNVQVLKVEEAEDVLKGIKENPAARLVGKDLLAPFDFESFLQLVRDASLH